MLAHGGQQSPRRSMSALLPKADIGTERRNVRFVPKADMNLAARGGRGLSEPTSHKNLPRSIVGRSSQSTESTVWLSR